MPFHKLRSIRQGYNLTIDELAELSGISPGTIKAIETGNKPYKINDATAEAIAAALYEQTRDIFDLTELSPLGRPPMTGTELRSSSPRGSVNEQTCPSCFLLTSITSAGICHHCERPL